MLSLKNIQAALKLLSVFLEEEKKVLSHDSHNNLLLTKNGSVSALATKFSKVSLFTSGREADSGFLNSI